MTDRLRRLHSDENGQILWFSAMSILALVILAAVIVNTGRQVARKIEMQNAADASAVSGAVWIARGMNVISMDNVGMTEALGLIANLRAMHVAWQINEVVLTAEWLAGQAMLESIILAPIGAALMVSVAIGWGPTCAVEGLDGSACSPPTGVHVSGMGKGNYEELAYPASGTLWQFMKVLQGMSETVTIASPVLAFAEAYNVGTGNITHMGNGEAKLALLTPNFGNKGVQMIDGENPKSSGGYKLPVEEGAFQELCDPTRRGTIDDATGVNRRGYVPLGYSNAFGFTYTEKNKGPFEKYKDEFNVIWWLSFVTSMPEKLYRGLANLSMSSLCGGDVPALPNIEKKIWKLDEARATRGAKNFSFTHTFVQTTRSAVRTDPFCPKSTNSACFDPTNMIQINEQLDKIRNRGNADDVLKDTQDLENGLSVKPTYDPPIDATSFKANGPVVSADGSWPPYPICEPAGPAISTTGSWCRLRGKDVYEKIWLQCVKNCPNNDPSPSDPAAKPPGPPEYLYFDERYIFEYATVSQSVDQYTGGLSKAGSADDYPQPMHFTLGNGDLRDHPGDLPAAIERLQYLALAYRGSTALPWMSGAVVSTAGARRPVFENPNKLGILTYAQSQVYNPTSWDMYTQDWRVKLVPASLLERSVGTFPGGMETVFTMFAPMQKVLNAH